MPLHNADNESRKDKPGSLYDIEAFKTFEAFFPMGPVIYEVCVSVK